MKAGLIPAALLAAWLSGLLAGCFDDKSMGGTDEVENPALTATLRDAQGLAVSGSVKVYARYQNPFKDSLAVMEKAAGAQGTVIKAADLLAAMDSAARSGVPWKNRDSVAFNLVGAKGSEESFRGDYLLVKGATGTYAFKRINPPEGGDPYAKGSLSTQLPLAAAVTGYAGSVGARGLELKLKSLFVSGSPYKAPIGSDGSFTLARIAPGRYDVKAVDEAGKVYSSLDSLGTDMAFAPSDWSEADIIWVGD